MRVVRRFEVVGYGGCEHFNRAALRVHQFARRVPDTTVVARTMDRPEFSRWVSQRSRELGVDHDSSPLVTEQVGAAPPVYVGGASATVFYLQRLLRHLGVSKPLPGGERVEPPPGAG